MDKYSSYKDSGFAWMGQIPSHWETRRFRFLLAENAVQNTDLKERKQLQFKYGDIVPKANQSDDKDVLDTIRKYTVVAPGDIMINGLNLNYDFISQRVAQVREPGVITSAYVSLRPLEGANSKYYTYYMKAMDAQKMFHGMGSGVRLTLSYDNLKNLFFPYPSPKEQEAIVSYLDTTTAKIDEAIAQQQRMIDLLNERKQIVINNAVTRGVSSCITYRESGYDWIGVIPSHWEIRKLKYYVTPSREKAYKALPYIGLENIESHTGKFILTDSEYDINQSLLCNKNDVIFGKLRPYLAKAYLCDRNYCCSNEFVVMRDTPVPKFLQYVLLSTYFVNKVDASTYGAKMPRADIDYILNLPIAIPPVNEQGEIVRSVNEQFSIIDKMIAPKAKLLSLLQERKQIIINDVVTGKVKVF